MKVSSHQAVLSSWVFLISAGVIQVQGGWWFLFPALLAAASMTVYFFLRSSKQGSEDQDTPVSLAEDNESGQEAIVDPGFLHEIVQAYLRQLDADPPDGRIVDTRKLPYPKAKIKQALMHELTSVERSVQSTELISAMVRLSSYQEGVGKDDVAALGGESTLNMGPEELEHMADKMASHMERYNRFKPAVDAEMKETLEYFRKKNAAA